MKLGLLLLRLWVWDVIGTAFNLEQIAIAQRRFCLEVLRMRPCW